jgi:hypothetical protein
VQSRREALTAGFHALGIPVLVLTAIEALRFGLRRERGRAQANRSRMRR